MIEKRIGIKFTEFTPIPKDKVKGIYETIALNEKIPLKNKILMIRLVKRDSR